MAIKERKQITGTEAQIKDYAGHNGVLAYATDTKHLHVLSGTAGTTTELANRTDIPDITVKADMSAVEAMQAQIDKLPKPKAYVTRTYVSGTQGYRVWSDGFIEQWGKVYIQGENSDNTLTFQKPFRNTNYNIQTAGWAISDRHACVVSKTTTSVTLKAWHNDNDWYAFGY